MKKRLRWTCAYLLTLGVALILIYWGNQAISVLAESAPIPRKHGIILDPGHGGIDGGATSVTGKPESHYNLEISLRIRDLLLLLGHEVRMTRTNDTSVHTTGNTIAQKKISDLKERVRIVEETPSAILVSIHQNQFPESQYYGAQVFYAGTQGSRELAEAMQGALASSLVPATGRKCRKSSGVYLMEHIKCPAILIECGFLSNFEEAERLENASYQKKLSCVIAGVLSQFLSYA